MSQTFFERVYGVVRVIPRGQVATYGQIARILEHPHASRTVGWALQALREGTDVPWYRVVTALGAVHFAEQRALLEQEGVVFDAQGRVDMRAYQWAAQSWLEIQLPPDDKSAF